VIATRWRGDESAPIEGKEESKKKTFEVLIPRKVRISTTDQSDIVAIYGEGRHIVVLEEYMKYNKYSKDQLMYRTDQGWIKAKSGSKEALRLIEGQQSEWTK
jgi:hypothetical protein